MTRQAGKRTTSKIIIGISNLNLSEDFFRIHNCGFGFMFKARARDFLTEENMKRINRPGEPWNFKVEIYPEIFILEKEERNRLISLRNSDIWVIIPQDNIIISMEPQPNRIMSFTKEDEERVDLYANITGQKPYKAGQIAVNWTLKDLKTEKVIRCLCHPYCNSHF